MSDIAVAHSGATLPHYPIMKATTTATQVKVLEGLHNFDDWIETLKANLASKGLINFITLSADSKKPQPGEPGFVEWDLRRQLTKAIIKCSTTPVAGMLLDAGWNAKAKDPKEHFDMIVGVMATRAEASGLVGNLVFDLCRIDRADFDSLAAYQNRLQTLKHRLANLGYCLDERFLLWIAINGLKHTNPHRYSSLESSIADGSLDWAGLMQDMWARAVKEHTSMYDTESGSDNVE